MLKLFAEAQKLIISSQNILIAGHQNPDADSLGSSLALKSALAKSGKKVQISVQTPIPENLKFLPRLGELKKSVDWREFDLIIGLDYGNIERLDIANFDPLSEVNFITFDHHLPDNQKELRIIQPDLSSTSELIFLFLGSLRIPFSAEIAGYLLTGIFEDTGGFRHPTTSPQTLETAAELLKNGACLAKIARHIQRKNPSQEADLLSRALGKIQIDQVTGLLTIFFSQKDLASFPENFDKASILELLTSIPGVKTVLFLQEKNGELEGSLRNQKEDVNVARLAQIFGGGGHARAAGFRTLETPETVMEKIKTALKNLKA